MSKRKKWSRNWFVKDDVLFIEFTSDTGDVVVSQFSKSRLAELGELFRENPVWPAPDSRGNWRIWYTPKGKSGLMQIMRNFVNARCVCHRNNDPLDNRDENIFAGSMMKNSHDSGPCVSKDFLWKRWVACTRTTLLDKSSNKKKTFHATLGYYQTAEAGQHAYARFLQDFIVLSIDERQDEAKVMPIVRKHQALNATRKRRTKEELEKFDFGPEPVFFINFLLRHYPDLAAKEY